MFTAKVSNSCHLQPQLFSCKSNAEWQNVLTPFMVLQFKHLNPLADPGIDIHVHDGLDPQPLRAEI